MQMLVIAIIVTLVVVYGSKKVLALMRMTRQSLHDRNMRRRAEKEAEKLAAEQEQDVYKWQAYCKQRAAGGQQDGPDTQAAAKAGGKAGTAGEADIVLFDKGADAAEPVAAKVLAAETVQ